MLCWALGVDRQGLGNTCGGHVLRTLLLIFAEAFQPAADSSWSVGECNMAHHTARDDCGPTRSDFNPAPVLFLVIANISKRCNVRSLIASALAFGAEVLVSKS